MKTIGLVGGVASGKSLVAKMFVDLGAGLLDADRAGHEVLAHDPAVRQALLARWGDSILASNGSIDRTAIAARVFASDNNPASNQAAIERAFLESLLHPRIQAKLDAARNELAAQGRLAVILDAPLLLEAGWGSLCDLIVMVESAPEVRLARAASRGWTAAQFASREATQWPLEKKRAAASVTLANDGTPDELRVSVHAIWKKHVAP